MTKKNETADILGFGNAIRLRRKSLCKTLLEVATETELTVGFLSQIERDISSPSLSSSMRIAAALQTTIEQLLQVPEAFSPFVKSTNRSKYSLGNSGRLYEKLGPGFSGALVYPNIIHRPVGHVSEVMQHKGEAFCYLLEGQINYHLDGETHEMFPGDSIHHDTAKVHYSEVMGDRSSVELWVSSAPMIKY